MLPSIQSKITRRIEKETGTPGLVDALAKETSPSDLQSLLLSIYKTRVQSIRESEVLARAGRNALVAPSTVDARLMNTFDRAAFIAAEGFEAVELSPVCPLGANHVLGGIDQNNVLTTIRNAEVLGDSTPAMAVECARRRKDHAQRTSRQPVRLCSSHRVVRLQPFDVPGFTPHFRLFGMVSAGRDIGSSAFEIAEIQEHIRFYLKLFRALNHEGFSLTRPLVEISDMSVTEAHLESAGITRDQVREAVRAHLPRSGERFLAERNIALADGAVPPEILGRLATDFPEAEFQFKLARLEGLGYYTGLCLRISPAAPDGIRYPIVDGGVTDWTARLLQDKKERFLTSGIGSEFVCRRYRGGV